MTTELEIPPTARPRGDPPERKPASGGIPLGSLFGIRITLDTSWLLIFALISFSLYASLPGDYPGRPRTFYAIGALAASLVFFASILLHELSHSVVARSRGMQVRGITLFFFGGVSQLEDEPRKPADEFLMAVVGPLTSAVLGVVFIGMKLLFPSGSLASGLLAWLGFINLALAAFNLLPGFPLDGGRVFRSIAWAATGSLLKATRLAARAGSLIAYALILWGILQAFLYDHMVEGLWYGFLGWFLLSAAQKSVEQLQRRLVLDRLRVSEILRPDCGRVGPEESVAQFVEERLLRSGERCTLVADGDGTLLGLLTVHEVKALPRDAWPTTPIRAVMVPLARLRTTGPDRPLLEALEAMNESRVNQLPVVEGSTIRGLVTREDLLRRLSVHLELGGGGAGPIPREPMERR